MGALEIKEELDKFTPLVRASFVVDTITYLYRGGRCSAVAAFGATALNLKPSIVVENGKMSVGKKFRGKFDVCVQKYIQSLLENNDSVDTSRVSVEYAYGITEAQVDMIKREIRKYKKFDEVITVYTSSTITAHCGQGVIGVLYLEK